MDRISHITRRGYHVIFVTFVLQGKYVYQLILHPSGHITFIQRRLNVDATSWRCIDVEATLYRRHVSAGMFTYIPNYLPTCSIASVFRSSLIFLNNYIGNYCVQLNNNKKKNKKKKKKHFKLIQHWGTIQVFSIEQLNSLTAFLFSLFTI